MRHIKLAAVAITACFSTAPMADQITEAYQAGVVDAAFVEKDEIYDKLTQIDKSNNALVWNEDKSKILVATWKSQGSYENFMKPYTASSDNPAYALWVTAVPQVKALCASVKDKGADAVNLRLKQYLGLDPSWSYDVFVEMWVNPADMFRPCVDPETSDSACQLNFGDSEPKVRNIPDYKEFYEDLYYKSFRGSAGVPWTGLGYTYDWGNPDSDVGASEFILRPGTPYVIHDVKNTMDYCQ